MSHRIALFLLAAALLTGCGSSPKTSYFTLTAVPATERPAAAIPSPVTVAAVNVPAALDRREIVRSTGVNSVDVSSQERWVAPLGDMARRVLSEDLAARLPKDKLVLPDAPSPQQTASIVVSIAEFGPDASGAIVLDGSWSLVKSGQNDQDVPKLRRDIALKTRVSAEGASGQAAGMSQLLGQLASQIAAALARTS